MAIQPIPKLKETFSDNKEPNGQDFANLIDSFDHKSVPLDKSRVLGLQQDLESKASKDDLQNVVAGLNPMGSVDFYTDLATKPKRNNDAYFVKDRTDTNGNPYIFRYDIGLDEWVNTQQVVYNNIEYRLLTPVDKFENIIPAILDNEGKLIFGNERETGKPVIPLLEQALHNIIGLLQLSPELRTELQSLSEKGQLIFVTNSDEWIFAILDAEYKVIFGIDRNNNVYPLSESSIGFKYVSNDEWLIALLDKELKVVKGLRRDGTEYPNSINSGSNSTVKIGNRKYIDLGHIDAGGLEIELYDFNLGNLTAQKNEVNARIRIKYKGVVILDVACVIAYQGTSSMADPKKNFSITFLNDEGDELYIRLNGWVEMESFQFKAYFKDATLIRDLACNDLYEEIVLTRPFYERRPWSMAYDAHDSNLNNRFNTGATGHVDGVHFSLYINSSNLGGSQYWGEYFWNKKKHVANYTLDKKNPLHIWLEASGSSDWRDLLNEEYWERRSKTWTAETLAIVQSYSDIFTDISNNIIDKELILDKFHINSWYDYLILNQRVKDRDGNSKNLQLVYINGKLAILPYDKDMSWGAFPASGTEIDTPTGNAFPSGIEGRDILYRLETVFKAEIKARYAELRPNILSHNNVMKIIEKRVSAIGIDAYKRNFERWDNVPSNTTIYTGLSQLASWDKQRIQWADAHYQYTE